MKAKEYLGSFLLVVVAVVFVGVLFEDFFRRHYQLRALIQGVCFLAGILVVYSFFPIGVNIKKEMVKGIKLGWKGSVASNLVFIFLFLVLIVVLNLQK